MQVNSLRSSDALVRKEPSFLVLSHLDCERSSSSNYLHRDGRSSPRIQTGDFGSFARHHSSTDSRGTDELLDSQRKGVLDSACNQIFHLLEWEHRIRNKFFHQATP